jgi:hypothetical protein
MNLPKTRPVQNKQVKPPKIDQDIAFVLETLNQPLEAGSYMYSFNLGSRPAEFKSGPEYLIELRQKLGLLGVAGVDMDASVLASLVPNEFGYGNQGVKVWSRDHHVLVLNQTVQLATVHELPVRASPEPIAA